MGKTKIASNRIKAILKKTGKAADRVKAAVRDFLIKVNPGP